MVGSIGVLLAASVYGCVAETTVMGDDRARAACAAAELIELPPSGCTPWRTLESSSPIGCTVWSVDGDPSGEELGTWIRVHRPVERPGRVEIRDLSFAGGPNAASVVLSGGGSPACTCIDGRMSGVLVRDETVSLALPYSEQEVLFATPHTFEVRVCNDTNDPFPACTLDTSGLFSGCSRHRAFLSRTRTACGCLPECDHPSDCPVPVTGNARMTCETWGCTMRCDAGETCPLGYECIAALGGMACAKSLD